MTLTLLVGLFEQSTSLRTTSFTSSFLLIAFSVIPEPLQLAATSLPTLAPGYACVYF